jgi:hypothetical protein
MNGYIAGPFQVVIGTHLFTVEIYVAPIEEDMLLSTTACNCIPCTSTGTLNITPLDSLSTVTAPSSSSSVTQVPILSSPPFSFQVVLGTHLFTVEIYVAPIEEDMLLGLDFLDLLQLVTACLVPLPGP